MMSIQIGNGNGSGGLIAVILFAVLMVVLIVIGVTYSRRRKKRLQESYARLGFTPQAQPDADFMAALITAYAPARVRKVSNLARKSFLDERYYLFDVTTNSPGYGSNSSDSSNLEYSNVGILSPGLALPSFMLITHIAAPGRISGLLDNMITAGAMSAGFYKMQGTPTAFDLNYMLFVKDEIRAREVFTDQVLNRIAMLDSVVARGEGRLLVFNRFKTRSGGKADDTVLAQQVDEARQMCEWLTE
jgi:hypothetical protein